jgi:alpha-glucosidase
VDIELGERRSRAAALILLALPGAIYLYQGEELGLPEVLDLPDAAREDPVFQRTNGQELGRDGCRVPLPWTEQPAHNFGFSTTDAPAWLPMPDGFGGQSVQAESARPDSTLALYRRAIAYRRASAALRLGPWTGLVTGHRDLLAFDRGDIRIVANFGDDALDIAALTAGRTVAVASAEGASAQRLSGNSALWLR